MPNPDTHDYEGALDVRLAYPPNAAGERAAGPRGGGGGEEDDGGLHARSAAFSGHTLIPARFSYDGGNTSPPLQWDDVPPGTREVVVLCEDPDAPGGTFTHWVVTGVPPEVNSFAEGSVPSGAKAGRNGFGEPGWGGPRPPVGDEPHRYFFRVFAVDRPVELPEDATAEDVHAAVRGHVLAKGTLVGLFGR
ncbi:YbhB/YbcL family Raf kinase inhibitor-like protein [Saccharothrix variisporea]|uniref:PBP family phospholipid-binding protein n=1 Tax=Saccharothrix variisporea TaxID=543527 RepID=A0A495XP76_9PSEU|nr:YbhB/YbcL family Raf kinase inhibitor-like protein [Saccharothrix variisporea]RKT74263.1 hypothetical protein DFJ66_7607 [Saccharothrix variisporea]